MQITKYVPDLGALILTLLLFVDRPRDEQLDDKRLTKPGIA